MILSVDQMLGGMPVLRTEPLAIFLTPLLMLEFTPETSTATIPVAIPYLPGMDALRVERARLDLRGRAVAQSPVEVAATSMTQAHTIGLGSESSDPRTGQLITVELLGLEIEAPAESNTARVLYANGGGSTTHLVWGRDAEGQVYFQQNGGGGDALHIMVRAATGSSRPPVAAFPSIAMPGQGAALYGPALAGGTVTLAISDGKGRASLTCSPGLDLRHIEIVVGRVTEDGGLPNELALVNWSATTIRATWSTPPTGLKVEAIDGSSASAVAEFPGALAVETSSIDFTPVARALLAPRYLETASTATDVTLDLRVDSQSAGTIEVLTLSLAGEYVRTPFPEGTAVELMGAPKSVRVHVPPGLRPKAFTTTLDGTFGPARLVDACEPQLVSSRAGVRLQPGRRLARFIPLTGVERGLPLRRVGIFARADAPTEVLISICAGDPTQIGSRRGTPVSASLEARPQAAWLQAELPFEAGVSPHANGYYVMVEITRGSLWWYTTPAIGAAGLAVLHSLDDGATWSRHDGIPVAQLHVDEIDDRTGEPAPAPILVAWPPDTLATDLLGVSAHGSGPLPASFREQGVTLLGRNNGDDDPLGRVREAGEYVDLSFSCRRDLNLRITDVVFSYNPWGA